MGALRHGVPLVILPLAAADNAANAARVAALGAGIVVDESARSASVIRDAIRAVLEEPRYRAAALDVAQSIRSLPPIESAAGLIEQLARDRQPVLTN
jgi:UDP:flavonoid glycosyltransferase YjiC (YdhE family)